jgi:TetR/AcrR family transcriptional regulator, transcriptional repressor of aconitase
MAAKAGARGSRAAEKRLTRKEKQAQTRERLLDAAERVFQREGLAAASVERITAEAGFTRGAFYSNFESKEQLFVELLMDRVYKTYIGMNEEIPEERTHLEQLQWTARQLRTLQERPDTRLFFALWFELLAHAARNPDFAELPAAFWKGNRALMTERIKKVYAELDEDPPERPKDLATALIALDIGLSIQHLVDPKDVPLSTYDSLYPALFAPEGRPPPGPKKRRGGGAR